MLAIAASAAVRGAGCTYPLGTVVVGLLLCGVAVMSVLHGVAGVGDEDADDDDDVEELSSEKRKLWRWRKAKDS